ncbi:MAG TPA: glycoside hydrolase family 3 N-terminal domain-containing protein, partial [Sporichthya sp.]|nr:glycoside hydrolase family 3 N-terminal domain-containing protein [Sporichthya sp.]
MRRVVGVVAAAGLLAACGSGGGPTPVASPASSGRPTSTPSPTLAASATPSGAASCLSPAQIAAWPVERRAATVITLPVLNFDLDAVAPELAAGAGGVLFLGSDPAPSNLGARVRAAAGKAPGKLLITADQEGGGIQRLHGAVPDLPWPADLAASATPEQVRKRAAALGRTMAALGINVDLAPVLDVDDRPGPSADNPDGKRSFSG